ncbi:hypothetical protein CI102_1050 [Trichoderma harzianum]|nr:hypothetical protein CI102_1050 [Trichoderma harzianum]
MILLSSPALIAKNHKSEARLALAPHCFPFSTSYTRFGLAVGVTMVQHFAVHEIQRHVEFVRNFVWIPASCWAGDCFQQNYMSACKWWRLSNYSKFETGGWRPGSKLTCCLCAS